jgi:hypothetical protein
MVGFRPRRPPVFTPGRRRDAAPPVLVGDHTDKLSRIRPIVHDEDERQTREDRDYGQTFFTRYFTLMRAARR